MIERCANKINHQTFSAQRTKEAPNKSNPIFFHCSLILRKEGYMSIILSHYYWKLQGIRSQIVLQIHLILEKSQNHKFHFDVPKAYNQLSFADQSHVHQRRRELFLYLYFGIKRHEGNQIGIQFSSPVIEEIYTYFSSYCFPPLCALECLQSSVILFAPQNRITALSNGR